MARKRSLKDAAADQLVEKTKGGPETPPAPTKKKAARPGAVKAAQTELPKESPVAQHLPAFVAAVLQAVGRPGARVEAGEGLVQQDEARVGGQRACDFDPPPFAAGERGGFGLAQMRDLELFQQLVAACPAVGAAHAQQFHHGQQVVLYAQLAEHARLLRQIAHAAVAGAAVHRQASDLAVVEEDVPLVAGYEPHDHVEGGGLARAVGSQQPDYLAGVDLEREAREDLAGPVTLAQ